MAPIRGLLVGVREGEHTRLAEARTADLQSDRKSLACEPARHADRGNPQPIDSCMFSLPRNTAPAKLTHDHGILARRPAGKQRAGGCRTDTCGVDVVLERDREAVQRPATAAGGEFSLQPAGLLERGFGVHGNIGVDTWVETLEAREVRSRDLNRR